jgi:NADPH2:quinone reductase
VTKWNVALSYPRGPVILGGTSGFGCYRSGQSSGPVAPFDPGRLSGITGAGRGAGSLTLSWVAASHYLTSQHDRAAAVSAILAQLTAGRFSPRIAARFPLSSASEAHTRLASRTVLGKILLQA